MSADHILIIKSIILYRETFFEEDAAGEMCHFHLDSPCESVSGNKWVVSDLSQEEIRQRGESMQDVDLSVYVNWCVCMCILWGDTKWM